MELGNFAAAYGVAVTLTAMILGAKSARDVNAKKQYEDAMRNLKESNDAYVELLQARDLQHQADTKQHESNVERIRSLEQTVKVLDDRVTQAPDITKLAVQLGRQHSEMMKATKASQNQMGKMAKELGNIAKAIVK
jgi:methylthioribose-1-phosphate isomerase